MLQKATPPSVNRLGFQADPTNQALVGKHRSVMPNPPPIDLKTGPLLEPTCFSAAVLCLCPRIRAGRSIVRRIAYLKRRFLEDLREGAKIFVRRGRDSRPETMDLFLSRFRRLSQAWVLLVVETDDDRRRGTVVELGHRYMVGYVDRLAITGDVLDSEVETWVDLLLHAYGIVHGGNEGSTAPELRPNAVLSLPMLEQYQSCLVRRLRRPSCEDAVVAVEITRDMTFDEPAYAVEFADFPSDQSSFVCSLWILVRQALPALTFAS